MTESPSESELKGKIFENLFSSLSYSLACQIIDAALSAEVDRIYNGMTEDERVKFLEENND